MRLIDADRLLEALEEYRAAAIIDDVRESRVVFDVAISLVADLVQEVENE